MEKAITVDVSGALADHVSASVGADGLHASEDEFIRDLIRRDCERVEDERLRILKVELQRAFVVPEEEAAPFDADRFRARMIQRHG